MLGVFVHFARLQYFRNCDFMAVPLFFSFFRKKILLDSALSWEQLESWHHFISTGFLKLMTVMFLWQPGGVRRDIILSPMNPFPHSHSVLCAIAHSANLICQVWMMLLGAVQTLFHLVLNAVQVAGFKYFLMIPYQLMIFIHFYPSH